MNYCLRSIASLPLLLVICLLTACGFHLRGQMDVHSELATLSVAGDDIGFVRQLTRALNSSGIQVTEDAPYRVRILSLDEQVQERTQATAGHYEKLLQVKIAYQLETQSNLPLFVPVIQTAERYVSSDENAVNAAVSEDTIIYKELRENLLFRIIKRIVAISADTLQQEADRANNAAKHERQQGLIPE